MLRLRKISDILNILCSSLYLHKIGEIIDYDRLKGRPNGEESKNKWNDLLQ